MSGSQTVLTEDEVGIGRMKRQDFKNQDAILTSLVRNLCGCGGLPILVVEQPWFRCFMRDVEPRFSLVSRVAVKKKLDELYTEEQDKLLLKFPHLI